MQRQFRFVDPPFAGLDDNGLQSRPARNDFLDVGTRHLEIEGRARQVSLGCRQRRGDLGLGLELQQTLDFGRLLGASELVSPFASSGNGDSWA